MANKKYMLLFHGGSYEGFSPEQVQQGMQKWFGWIDKLKGKNIYKEGDPLVYGGKVLSQKNGKYIIDGPYAETKEQVGGFFIIEAASEEEVIEIAKEYPDFHLDGCVEIREVMIIPGT